MPFCSLSSQNMLQRGLSNSEPARDYDRVNNNLKNLPDFKYFQNLNTFDIIDCPKITILLNISKCKKLKHITIDHCPSLSNVSEIKYPVDIEILNLEGSNNLIDISFIQKYKNLEILRLESSDKSTLGMFNLE